MFSNVSVTADDVASLRDGKLPDTVRQSFESYGEVFDELFYLMPCPES
jgi:hypothetical protein